MTRAASAANSVLGQQGSQSAGGNDALRGLDMDEFLKLMIAELQNQDPLDPMKNSEILEQVSQIREIESTGRLTDTLDAVLLGQQLNSASGLIGKQVKALAGQGNQGEEVTGVIDRVSIADGQPVLHVGDKSFAIDRIREIVADARPAGLLPL